MKNNFLKISLISAFLILGTVGCTSTVVEEKEVLDETHRGDEVAGVVVEVEDTIKTTCEANSGKWVEDYKECEDVAKDWCDEHEGRYSECASDCRHQVSEDGSPVMCNKRCVQVCDLN